MKSIRRKIAVKAAEVLFSWLAERAAATDNDLDDIAVQEAKQAVSNVIRRAL